MRKSGFTLIELLIVVAIIAILAAIAVPNFLEAQVRAKVSRVRSDMRSIGIALEAYFVDWNSYTVYDAGDNPQGTYAQGCKWLTTPVAYMTMVPFDSFGDYRDKPGGTFINVKPMYELGTGDAATKTSSAQGTDPIAIVVRPGGMPSNTWMLRSVGPDKFDGTALMSYPYRDNTSIADVPGQGMTMVWSNNAAGVAGALSLIYDPTNGTVSLGDIYRVGGVKPAGMQWDAFFTNTTK